MNKEIRIKFNKGIPDDARTEYKTMLSQWFDVTESEKYDYYFAMETIYTDKNNMQDLLESDVSAIRIMILGEAIYPDLNLFDYVVFYWSHFESLDRIIYRPYLYSLEGSLFDQIHELDSSKEGIDAEVILYNKKKFCNFMYSNANAHYMRDQLFYSISKYKTVDSLGSHLKNVEIKDTRHDLDWGRKSVELKKPYKFSIAAENSRFPGYTTEKLVTSMLALTIPIYFGNPVVNELYNSNSYINVDAYNSLDDLVDYIREIDENDQLWCDIMTQPWRTVEQIEKCNRIQEEFINDIRGIFEKDKQNAIRRPFGTWDILLYPKHLNGFERKWGIRELIDSCLTKIIDISKR